MKTPSLLSRRVLIVSSLLATAAVAVPLVGSVAPSPPSALPPAGSTTTLRALYGLQPPKQIDTARSALLLIDFQEEFFHGRLPLPDGPQATFAARKLLNWARRQGITVVHVNNEIKRPGSPVFAAGSPGAEGVSVLAATPNERVLIKASGGAFTNTDLDEWLKARHVELVVVAGLMTHLAVQLTASDATVKGYRVVVAADATATRDLPLGGLGTSIDHRTLQRAALASLGDRFADVMPVRDILDLPRL